MPLFNPVSICCRTVFGLQDGEDSEMSDFANSSQASGHNQDMETIDEFSHKVVEGKLLKFSLPNKIRIVIFNRHLMQSSFGGKIGL